MSRRIRLAIALLALGGGVPAALAQNELGYDPGANPFEQLAAAVTTARASNKLILVVAGGDWCIWCHYLDAFLKSHDSIEHALKDTFVVVKAYRGDENDNDAFFATLPQAAGYPHFWVLDEDGELLSSQDTLPLEDGDKSYDPASFTAFIDFWSDTP